MMKSHGAIAILKLRIVVMSETPRFVTIDARNQHDALMRQPGYPPLQQLIHIRVRRLQIQRQDIHTTSFYLLRRAVGGHLQMPRQTTITTVRHGVELFRPRAFSHKKALAGQTQTTKALAKHAMRATRPRTQSDAALRLGRFQ
ncbi:hypothetical protein GY26_05800 [Gammaproteobacteria bacterium MFB021]|nr:hypothetical protein GY26_05800 [Gammaproteobacteria bacterium MFB021]